MRKLLTFLIALGAIVFAVVSPVSANGVLILAQRASAPTYQGPGDITNTFLAWASCAFVYKASLASNSTNVCDLVASGTTTPVVCTLRATSSGNTDLSLCADGVTVPATACSGGCAVSKAYDQSGHGVDLTASGTASQYPVLTFSALGGQPCLTKGAGNVAFSSTANMGTATAPFTGSVVAKALSTSTSGEAVLGVLNSYGILYSASNLWALYGSASTPTFTAADNTFHAVQIIFNGASSSSYVDGTLTNPLASDPGGLFLTGRTWQFFNRNGIAGTICEGGWSTGDQSASYSALNSNQHSRYGF